MADDPPRVSIVCIFYDAEAFLAEAIESAVAQDFADWEFLLVDDGSRDGGTCIAKQFAARSGGRVRYLDHPGHANRGMSASRNLGLAEARGEFVAFIDADDVWRPDKLARQVALLDREPEVGMVCGAVNYWRSWRGGKDRVLPTGHLGEAVSRPPETILELYPLGAAHAPCPSDVMLRRSLVEAIGGFEERFTELFEDQAFFAKVYLASPIYFSREVWLDYRQHEASSVSLSHRGGRYMAMKRSYLDWLSGYLATHPEIADARVERAIARARWALDHPFAARALRRLRGR